MSDGIGLAEAIIQLRAELLAARAQGVNEDIQFPIESLTLELKVVATLSAEGKAGFRVPFINAELGGGRQWGDENTQTVTIVFGPPLDPDGKSAKIAQATNFLPG